MRRGIRIGGAFPSASARDGKSFFTGQMSNVAFYGSCLSADRIRAHMLCVTQHKTKDAQRLYALSASKYELALTTAPEDTLILKNYVNVLCSFFHSSLVTTISDGIAYGKEKLCSAMHRFEQLNLVDGIAQVLVSLPRDVEYMDMACKAYEAIKRIKPNYFQHDKDNTLVTRKDLINVPRAFGIDKPSNALSVLDTAANIYKDVLSDLNLCDTYGETNLYWLYQLRSSELIVALIHYAHENGNLKTIRIGKFYEDSLREEISATDADIKVISIQYDLVLCEI